MPGVEILSSSEVVIDYSFNITAFWITTIIGIFIFTILLCNTFDDISEIVVFIIFSIILSSLFGTLIGMVTSKPSEYETQYKVTVSDEVAMNDFLDGYEIIDQEGKIYIVREIE